MKNFKNDDIDLSDWHDNLETETDYSDDKYDKEVMRDMMMMCYGMWTDVELKRAYQEGIISEEDYNDLIAGMAS